MNKTIRLGQTIRNSIKRWRILTAIIILWTIFVFATPVNWVAKAFAITAGLNFYIFTVYFGNIFNFVILFSSLFLFMIGCSQAKLTAIEQNNFSFLTWLTFFVALVCCYGTLFLFQKFRKKKESGKPRTNESPDELQICGRTILWANLLLLLAEICIYYYAFRKLGGIPLFDDYLRVNVMPKVLSSVWMIMMVLLPAMLIIFDIVHIANTKKYQYFAFVFLFIFLIMLLGGRLNIFIPIVTALFYLIIQLYLRNKDRLHLIITSVVLLMIVMVLIIGMPLLRTSVYKDNGEDYYAELYEDTGEDIGEFQEEIHLPAILQPLWLNFSIEMHGFDWMVKTLAKTGEYQYGRMFLLGPLNFICKYFISQPNVDVLRYEWLNVLTFMHKPYLDFGVFGVGIFMVLYTFAGMHLYNKAIRRKSLFTLLLYCYFCMTTLFFVCENHFMYTTFVVNTVLLFLFSLGLSIDWLKLLHFKSAQERFHITKKAGNKYTKNSLQKSWSITGDIQNNDKKHLDKDL